MDPFTSAALGAAGKKLVEYIAQEHTCSECTRLSASIARTYCCQRLICSSCLSDTDFWTTSCCDNTMCDSCVAKWRGSNSCRYCGSTRINQPHAVDTSSLIDLGPPVQDQNRNTKQQNDTQHSDRGGGMIIDERKETLKEIDLTGVMLIDWIPGYDGTAVCVSDDDLLSDLGRKCGNWVEALHIQFEVRPRKFQDLIYFEKLKYLRLLSTDLKISNECSYAIGKLSNLRHLELPSCVEEFSTDGLKQWRNLKNLEFVRLPHIIGDPDSRRYDSNLPNRVRDSLKSIFPNAVIEL